MNAETAIQRHIMLALSDAGCIVWRNNTGQGYAGRVIHSSAGTVTLADSRVIVFGLCKGSADLIGIAPGGRFLAVEVKTTKGKPTTDQQRFIDAIRAAGGIAGIARSSQDALDLLK